MNSVRPIWQGSISFGLVMIPVNVFSSDTHSELHFHLLDKRNQASIRYEKINEKTGKVVPWREMTKAYEFEKGHYIIINEQELEKTAYANSDSIEIENFVSKNEIPLLYFEKTYYLSPGKQGEKGYILLQRVLETTKKIGIAKFFLRNKQHLVAVSSYQNILTLSILRFPEEIRDYKHYQIPENIIKTYKASNKEITMAEHLIQSMSEKWNPKHYRNENREIIRKWIDKKIKTSKGVSDAEQVDLEKSKVKSTKIIDFMTLLKKSIKEKESQSKKKKVKKID